jgi:sensor histidine kinase YesM
LRSPLPDTGAGLDGGGAPGQGIGLANIRERLALLYGTHASLDLSENAPRGFIARIALPAMARAEFEHAAPTWSTT